MKKLFYFLLTLCLLQFSSCNISPMFNTNKPSEISSTPTPHYQPIYSENNRRPVAISYISQNDLDTEINSISLSQNASYSKILVDHKTNLRAPVAVDSNNNLYVLYGSKQTYLSKLSLDGSIVTIDLPVNYPFQSFWLGDKLIILKTPTLTDIYVINTEFKIQTLSLPFNSLPTEITGDGIVGIGNSSDNLVVWVSRMPIRNAEGNFAYYRTFDVDSGDFTEGRLPIPASTENWSPTGNSDDRLGTFVYGVDTNSGNVLLCYGHVGIENNINTTLELFSTSNQQMIAAENRCCLNNEFEMRGDSIIQNIAPESCSFSEVRNWSDFQLSFDVESYLSDSQPGINWLTSNGRYWILLTETQIVIFNEIKQNEAIYFFPADLPPGLTPGSTIAPAFALPNGSP